MSILKRAAISVLISTFALAAFSLFAFSGLFPWLESQFYRPRVVGDWQTRLVRVEQETQSWEKRQYDRLEALLSRGAFEGVFSPTESKEALQNRFRESKLFLMGIEGGGSLRILNQDRSQLEFSTVDSDVKVKSDFRLVYRPWKEVSGGPNLESVAVLPGKPTSLWDPQGKLFYSLLPWTDSKKVASGFVLLGASWEDLRTSLWNQGERWLGQSPVALPGNAYVASATSMTLDESLLSRIESLVAQGRLPPVQRLASLEGQTFDLIHQGSWNLVVSENVLAMSSVLKALILASLYTVFFLVGFLLLNLRTAPEAAVARRVKRFQLQVVRQYIDLKERDKIQSLRDELLNHSQEIRTDMVRSLGRIRRQDQEWVDRYIDTSWQEVMDMLRGPSLPETSSETADWKRLETLLQQALTQGRFVASPPGPATATPLDTTKPRTAPETEEVEELEELDEVEDLEEVEELDEVEELEELGEPEGQDDSSLAEGELAAEDDGEELDEVEELEVVVDDADPENLDSSELLSQPERLPFYATNHPRWNSGPVEDALESDSEPEELESLMDDDVEELEILEEEEAASTEVLSLSLEDLDAAWSAQAQQVFEEQDEVIQIASSVFTLENRPSDELGILVDEVMQEPNAERFLPLEDDVLPRSVSREWRWTGAGFDWTRFARGDDDVDLFRALSELVSEFDAFTAAILVPSEEGGWSVRSSVGFSDAGKELLHYPAEHVLVREYLCKPALHHLSGGEGNSLLQSSFHAKDLKFLQSLVLVPLLFEHKACWLILGLRRNPGDLLEWIAPRKLN